MSDPNFEQRREWAFLVLAGLFLGAMTLLNVIGITRFVQLGPLSVAVGVLPYPITFLCTDLISEIWGKKKATGLVWVGFLLNLFVIAIMIIADALPSVPADQQPPWQVLPLAEGAEVALPNGTSVSGSVELFSLIYATTAGAILASMVAYLMAQFCDVYVFHKLKELTGGKMLWLRNNVSTLISQLVDSFAVIAITFGAVILSGQMSMEMALGLLFSNYAFKALSALIDTPIIYACVKFLKPYLGFQK